MLTQHRLTGSCSSFAWRPHCCRNCSSTSHTSTTGLDIQMNPCLGLRPTQPLYSHACAWYAQHSLRSCGSIRCGSTCTCMSARGTGAPPSRPHHQRPRRRRPGRERERSRRSARSYGTNSCMSMWRPACRCPWSWRRRRRLPQPAGRLRGRPGKRRRC